MSAVKQASARARSAPGGPPEGSEAPGPQRAAEAGSAARALAIRYAAGSLLGIAVAGLAVWAVTARVCGDLRLSGRKMVADLAATIAASIPGEEHARLRVRADEETATYRQLRYQLLSIRQANRDVIGIYTLIPGETPDHWHFVIDAGINHASLRHIGDQCATKPHTAMEGAFGEPSADREPSREPWGNRLSGYAALRGRDGKPLGIVRVDVNADAALLREREFAQQAAGTLLFLAILISLLGRDRYQRRRVDLERARNLQTRLSLYRVADVMARAKTEEELARQSLDVVAEATGIAHWALYRWDGESRGLQVFASRDLPESALPELEPDPVGPDSESPVSRAAWHGEALVVRDPADMPTYRFAATTEGLRTKPVVLAVPLREQGETTAVLQGFIPRSRAFGTEDLALCRWLASQIVLGLRRLQLERRDQLLASFMMSSDEIVLGFDLDGAISYVNPAGERALGRPLHEIAGRSIDHFVTLTDDGTGSPFFEVIRAPQSFAGEVWFRRASGRLFPGEITVSQALDREGNQTALVLVGRDATERRERDEMLRTRSEQLVLVNEQLQLANETLQEANRMKNEFLANTSHELRTPLNAVIGFATLIEQGMLRSAEESIAFARSIRESAEHLLRVINDILDLAKVEAGRFQISLEVEDVAPLVRATAEVLRGTAQRKGLALRIRLPDEPLPMRLDEARMRQVLMNLLGNAIKFTDKGEVRVEALHDGDRGEIRILVEDTGVGIAPEDLPRLFTKFTQVDGSYKRRHQGTGLGLAITQSLVEKMNGRIAIESEGLGCGTRLVLAFPAVRAARTPTEPEVPAPARLAGEPMIPADRAEAVSGRRDGRR